MRLRYLTAVRELFKVLPQANEYNKSVTAVV